MQVSLRVKEGGETRGARYSVEERIDVEVGEPREIRFSSCFGWLVILSLRGYRSVGDR